MKLFPGGAMSDSRANRDWFNRENRLAAMLTPIVRQLRPRSDSEEWENEGGALQKPMKRRFARVLRRR